MRKGIALNDEQRKPWLLSLHNKLKELKSNNQGAVLACSALKAKYRHLLNFGSDVDQHENDQAFLNIKFILLNVDYECVNKRLQKRKHEYINGISILDSQFKCLEIHSDNPIDGFSYTIENSEDKSIENCVNEIENFIASTN